MENKIKLYQKIHTVSMACPTIKKDTTAKVQTKNGSSYSYDYVTLDLVQTALKPLLQEHKLLVVFDCYTVDQTATVEMHIVDIETGEKETISTTTNLINQKVNQRTGGVEVLPANMQDVMSYYTYNKRYMLIGKFNVIVEESDNDGKGVTITTKDKLAYNPELHAVVDVGFIQQEQFKAKVKEFEANGGGYDSQAKKWFVPKNIINQK
jgi:hypothetical protein